ncbi:alpha-N-acetylglucosaminidase-like isoform X2 [Haliotis rubra]|uniref:alpha-N-acetylglucosaminidase-like isoform X2 n=1 Tax=Haliotis rubra TaxID=36100 RepID=UPI001EE57584|nr:alpha-N-acetylglucosaminidase-like isoform X2 [Haliotis rubra]
MSRCVLCSSIAFHLYVKTQINAMKQVLQCYSEFSTLNHIRSKTPYDVQSTAAGDLISRVIGNRSSDFLVSVDPSIGPKNRDTFKLVSNGVKLSITGTSGVAVAMGFYYYLKYYCGGQYTWAGQQVALPAVLPAIASPGKTVTSNDQFRYYQNVCTVSYSFAWWDWTRWEREIDWMAMQGINLPLAFTGQEAMFQRVYMAMGFTNEDMASHFGGPAFLAWARMGNIHGWGGPLPQTWIDGRLILQHKILKRMRSLGITPVLPGFAGHVPAAITRVFPQANVTRLGGWSNFRQNYSETYLLDFNDPLFAKIGGSFIKAMEYEFGVDHIYNADTFNEMSPKSSDPAYLASAAKGVYNGMLAGDTQAIWLMQGWLFMSQGFWKPPQIKALLTAIPQGKMIILDLISELDPIYSRTESYYGQPFIWCMLHNFGGTMELYGALDKVNKGPSTGRSFPNTTMVGTGLTPEGINQNEVMYEFMNEQAWRPGPVNLDDWIDSYQKQRYGGGDKYTSLAWSLLKTSVYNSTSGHMDFNGVLYTRRPSVAMKEFIWYDPEQLYQAWDNMVLASKTPALGNNSLFTYDLVDVTRNSLQILSSMYYHDIIAAYNTTNTSQLQIAGQKMIDLLSDLDTLLASDGHFLLGKWTEAARKFSLDVNDTILYDLNSRNQVTLWGPTGQIRDYAAKQWSGLINKYYKPRWQLFVDSLVNSTKTGKPFNNVEYDQAAFSTVELPFSNDHTSFPTTVTGSSVDLAAKFHQKYRSETKSKFFSQFPRKFDRNTAFSKLQARQWGRALA